MQKIICQKHKEPIKMVCLQPDCKENCFFCFDSQCLNIHLNCYGMKVLPAILNKIFNQQQSLKSQLSMKLDEYFDRFSEQSKERAHKFIDQKLSFQIESQEIKKIHIQAKENGVLSLKKKELLALNKQVNLQTISKSKNGYFIKVLQQLTKNFDQNIKTVRMCLSNFIHLENQLIDQPLVYETAKTLLTKKGINLDNYELHFNAAQHNGQAIKYHKQCDGIAKTITLIKSQFGKIYGAYLNAAINSSGSWIQDTQAFLFSIDQQCICKINNQAYSFLGSASYGPYFGNNDILIGNLCLNNKSSSGNASSYTSDKQFSNTNYLAGNIGNTSFRVMNYVVLKLKS